MSQLTTRQSRNGLTFAEKIAELAGEAPDAFAKRKVYEAVNSMRQHYGFSDDEKKLRILQLLKNGCSSRKDLIRETSFPFQDIYKLLRSLCNDGKVRSTLMARSTGGRHAEFLEAI